MSRRLFVIAALLFNCGCLSSNARTAATPQLSFNGLKSSVSVSLRTASRHEPSRSKKVKDKIPASFDIKALAQELLDSEARRKQPADKQKVGAKQKLKPKSKQGAPTCYIQRNNSLSVTLEQHNTLVQAGCSSLNAEVSSIKASQQASSIFRELSDDDLLREIQEEEQRAEEESQCAYEEHVEEEVDVLKPPSHSASENTVCSRETHASSHISSSLSSSPTHTIGIHTVMGLTDDWSSVRVQSENDLEIQARDNFHCVQEPGVERGNKETEGRATREGGHVNIEYFNHDACDDVVCQTENLMTDFQENLPFLLSTSPHQLNLKERENLQHDNRLDAVYSELREISSFLETISHKVNKMMEVVEELRGARRAQFIHDPTIHYGQ